MEYTKEQLSDPTFRAWIGRPDEGYEDDLTPGRILEEAAYNMNDENATYEDYVDFLCKDVTENYMQELLQDDQLKDVALTAEQIQAEYDALGEEQMTYYMESPEADKYDQE